MNPILISPGILEKLRDKHGVSKREVEQCFENLIGTYVEDTQEDHKTDPATLWFVASTNCDRILKIIFIFIDGNIHIKSAYEPKQTVIDLYDRVGR